MTDQPDMSDWCRRAAECLGDRCRVDCRGIWPHPELYNGLLRPELPSDRIILAALLVTECERRGMVVDVGMGLVFVDCLSDGKQATLGDGWYTEGDIESRTNAMITSTVMALEADAVS